MTILRSANSGGTTFCRSCSAKVATKGGTNGDAHSKRYFCSSRGILAKVPNNDVMTAASTTLSSSLATWQCSWSPSIHSESICRSSTGMAPEPGAAASAFCTQVGISSIRTRTKKFSKRLDCRFASWVRLLHVVTESCSSYLLSTYCVNTPLSRTNSSRMSPRVLEEISRPSAESNLATVSMTPVNNGNTWATSIEKLRLVFSLIQKIMKQPTVFSTNSSSGHMSSHWSASMSAGISLYAISA
mmetsp:Transcript_98375/g.275473  ORF Transcript_98375/g.275473 Transcript_98375/m.275473 type:complete len:243 (-) Transcript_98375:220-948(-)